MNGVSLYLLTRVVAMAYLMFPGGNGLRPIGRMSESARLVVLSAASNRLFFGVWSEVTP